MSKPHLTNGFQEQLHLLRPKCRMRNGWHSKDSSSGPGCPAFCLIFQGGQQRCIKLSRGNTFALLRCWACWSLTPRSLEQEQDTKPLPTSRRWEQDASNKTYCSIDDHRCVMNESDSDLEGPMSDIATVTVTWQPLPAYRWCRCHLGRRCWKPWEWKMCSQIPFLWLKSCLRPGKMHSLNAPLYLSLARGFALGLQTSAR